MIIVMVHDFGLKYIMFLYFIMVISNYAMFYTFMILLGYSEKLTRSHCEKSLITINENGITDKVSEYKAL
jgi:hypothetical protein